MINNIKTILKRNPLIWELNAYWKCNRIKQKYYFTLKKYSNTQFNELFESKGKDLNFDKVIKKLKVLYVGTDEGQDYSGLLQGLGKVVDFEVFSVPGYGYGQLPALGKNALKQRIENGKILVDSVLNASTGEKRIDVVIGQMWGFRIDVKALDVLRAKRVPIVNISMDDRHAFWGNRQKDGSWGGTRGLIGHVDLACTAAPECVNWYKFEGCPAIFLPEASDPGFFKPDPDAKKRFDICFVGQRYGVREQIVNSLISEGLNVEVYGKNWPNGRIDANDVPSLFASSRIVLGVGTIQHCEDFFALKMRDFDGPMSGTLYLTNANPDLHLMYEVGKEIVTYKTLQECVSLARYYCIHDDEREDIARLGRLRGLQDHTWEDRFKKIIFNLCRMNKIVEKGD